MEVARKHCDSWRLSRGPIFLRSTPHVKTWAHVLVGYVRCHIVAVIDHPLLVFVKTFGELPLKEERNGVVEATAFAMHSEKVIKSPQISFPHMFPYDPSPPLLHALKVNSASTAVHVKILIRAYQRSFASTKLIIMQNLISVADFTTVGLAFL